jgi:predicted Zn-dependent protease
MRLTIVPMLSEGVKTLPDGLVEDFTTRVMDDESLGWVFDDFDVHCRISVPPLSELIRPEGNRLLWELKDLFPGLFGIIPYGDITISGRYTGRYMEEELSRRNLDKRKGRVFAITDVPLCGYHDMGPDVFHSIIGCRLSFNTTLSSYYYFQNTDGFDMGNFYKTSKHELGHVLGMEHCTKGPCILNPTIDLTDRPGSYCDEHKRILAETLIYESGK